MPARDEISEEGFGYFRGTWFIGRVLLRDAIPVLSQETEIIDWLDTVANDPLEFETLALAIERGDTEPLDGSLGKKAAEAGAARFLVQEDEPLPLVDLEVGVAGLTCALSAVGCLTAASCRAHTGPRSWSDCPVVFFAAPMWRVEILGQLISSEGCGLEAERGMLSVYGRSVRDTHRLGERIIEERRTLRKIPGRAASDRHPESRIYRRVGCPASGGPSASPGGKTKDPKPLFSGSAGPSRWSSWLDTSDLQTGELAGDSHRHTKAKTLGEATVQPVPT
jgi:hypothetical protein